MVHVSACDRDGLGHVGATEEGAVDHDDVHLVQGDALAPPVRQGRGLVIGGEYAFIVRTAEDREGRQVLLGVAALRGGVDEDRPIGGPHDVAGPQVAVGAGRADASGTGDRVGDEARLAVVERPRFEALAQALNESPVGRAEGRGVQVGGDTFARVEGAPGLGRDRGRVLRCLAARRAAGMAHVAGHTTPRLMHDAVAGFRDISRQRQGRLPHPPLAIKSRRWHAQVTGARGVRVGEGAAEPLGSLGSWRDGDQARFLEPRRAVIEDGHDGGPRVRGLSQPREARDLVGDPPAAAVPLPDGVHRSPPSTTVIPAVQACETPNKARALRHKIVFYIPESKDITLGDRN